MDFIEASRLSEFLDDNKNESLDRESLRADYEILKNAGVEVPPQKGLRSGKKSRVLEYFLLRSQLYKLELATLVPNRISNYWSDYAKAWFDKINGKDVHLPFYGKIVFVCHPGKKIICHPESASIIEKIVVDTGSLTLQKDSDKMEQRYMKRPCKLLLDAYNQGKLSGDVQNRIGNTPFGRALLSIGLAKKTGDGFSFRNGGLLIDEMKKIKSDDNFEKVARLILRYEQQRQAKVSSVITCLETLERIGHPSETPIGSAPRFWESKRTGKRYERLGYHDLVSGMCSLDSRVTADLLGKSDPYDGYVTFGSFMDTYFRTYKKSGRDWSDTFAFLSWYTDSLTYLGLDSKQLEVANFPSFKKEKTRKHREFLKRSINEKSFNTNSPKTLPEIAGKLRKSEIIDMNVPHDALPNYDMSGSYCNSNVYVATDVPVDRELFESTVLNILQSPSRFKDSQGAFYYPDFRFLVASTIGLGLRSVDQILAYVLSTNPQLSRRLWFYPSLGKVPLRDRPDEQLADVVLKPFDSITLNY